MYNLPKFKGLIILLLSVLILQACNEAHVNEIPVRDFFKTPEKVSFKMSPDGKYISYLKIYKKQFNLFVKTLATGQESRVTSLTDYPLRDYFWTINDQLVFTQSVERKEQKNHSKDSVKINQVKIYVLDLVNKTVKTIFTQDKVHIRIIQSKNRLWPDVITISMNKRDSDTFDVYRLNIRAGELKPYIINPGNITDWYPDQDGRIRLAKASDGVDESILYRANESMPFKAIIKNNFKNSVQPIAFTGNKNLFYALSNVGRDKSALVEINAENGQEDKVIFGSDKADISDVGYSKYKHHLELVSWEEAKQQTYFLNPYIKQIYQDLNKQLPGGKIKIVDRDSTETKFIINTYTDRDPGSYYLYEPAQKKLTKIGDTNPAISPDELCTMEPVSFKASDGLTINGYITYPKGKGRTNLPVVVLPHGGPWRRDSWGYNAEVQFLANRGYAVFQLNYRGSIGYGKAFYSAGFKQVGGKIQQDITDGVKWLIAQKIANAKKIAIMGGGFGGYSALYGLSFHPDLYNCAIMQYGLINFFTYIKDAQPYFKSSLQMMYEKVGNPETDADQLRAISPVFHADKIKQPLLIFQGGQDPQANVSELNQFVHELQRRKVTVNYVYKPKERASFRDEHNRVQMYTDIERFLDSNMRVKP